MKEYTMTKDAIANAFKELMKTKSFDKISISDITNSCKLNRQTFYYHFQDKYDLMNWIYYNEIFVVLVDGLNESNYEEKFYQMFDKMHKEKAIYVNALSMSGEYSFKDYLESVLNILVSKIFENKKSQDIKFCTFGLTGIIIDWIKRGAIESPKEVSNWISELLINFKRNMNKL